MRARVQKVTETAMTVAAVIMTMTEPGDFGAFNRECTVERDMEKGKVAAKVGMV